MRFLILSCGPPFSTEPTCVKFQTTLNVAIFEFGIQNFASDLREKDDNRIIQVTQNLAGAGCSAKNNILLLEETGQESQRWSKVFVSLH